MDKPVDFTQEIIAEAKLYRETFPELGPWLIFNSKEALESVVDYFHLTDTINNARLRHEEEIKTLAIISVLIELHTPHKGKGFELILEERNRQIERGYTIARDKMNYPGNELKRFALHRLTGLDIYYPFKDNGFKNTNGNHSEAERHIQAGAILLAHIQKNIAVNQLSEWLLHATKDERNLELAKEISDQ